MPAIGEEEVDEPGAGDLDSLGARSQSRPKLVAKQLCDLSRRLIPSRRQQHRRVGRVVAELGLRGALERRGERLLGVAKRVRRGDDAAAQLGEGVGHVADTR